MSEVIELPLRNGYSRMVYNDLLARVRACSEERKARLAAVRTRRQAEKYRDSVAKKTVRCFGRFPARTPLNAKVTGVIEGPHFRIEKVLFESRPGFLVTANLYVPNTLQGPAPAVLGSCGHSPIGKAADNYQAFGQELAQCGFVVLIFDPINQGERDQYTATLPADSTLRRSCTHAHNMMGKQLELTGDFFGAWRAWDGIRALDYLISREEVDPERVGITGNSGGGTMTTWLWALDRRLKYAAPSCFVTTFRANFENELPADAEQYPLRALAEGLEMSDFLIARAPDPAVLLAQKHCFFDRRGALEAAAETKRIYQLLGAEDHFDIFIGKHPHGYFPDARDVMRRFFCTVQEQRFRRRPVLTVLSPEELAVTKKLSVIDAGSTSLQEINSERAARLGAKRKSKTMKELERTVRLSLGLGTKRDSEVHYRVLRPDYQSERTVARYAVASERSIEAILRKVCPDPTLAHTLDVESAVTLYVPHLSTEADFIGCDWIRSKVDQPPLYGVDVRGLGESLPDETGDFIQPYGMDYMAHGYSLMLKESFLGRRVYDLLCTCDLLAQEGAKKITLMGKGQGALYALYAAVLHPRVIKAELQGAPESFESWVNAASVRWPAANCPYGVLSRYDLPDLYSAFKKKVSVHSWWDAAAEESES